MDHTFSGEGRIDEIFNSRTVHGRVLVRARNMALRARNVALRARNVALSQHVANRCSLWSAVRLSDFR